MLLAWSSHSVHKSEKLDRIIKSMPSTEIIDAGLINGFQVVIPFQEVIRNM